MSYPNRPCNLSCTPEPLIKHSQVKTHPLLVLRDPAMPQSQIKFAHVVRQGPRAGMTLIELLIAVSILVILAGILVPQLRFASADRNIREASRLAASLFAQASQRAINDGEAGVLIERNPNILDAGTGNAYAGTSLFMLRQVPRYTGEARAGDPGVGDDPGEIQPDQAELIRTESKTLPERPEVVQSRRIQGRRFLDIFITRPLEQDELGVVRVGDQISFGDQANKRYLITKTDYPEDQQIDNFDVDRERKLRLQITAASDFIVDGFPDGTTSEEIDENNMPTNMTELLIGDGSFTVYRQPRKLESSRVDMPTGYLIDLRLSGQSDGVQMLFDQDDRSAGTAENPNSIVYLYNRRGAIDRFFYSADIGSGLQRLFNIPTEPAYLLVREYSTDDGGELVGNVLASNRTMWVTVDPGTGTANVVSGVAVDTSTFDNLQEALREAHTLSSQGQSAAQ